MLYDACQERTLALLKDLLQSFEPVQAAFAIGSLADDDIQVDF